MTFWAFAITVFALSVLYTWVFNNTQRSILAVIMLHFMYNSTLNVLSPLSDRASIFATGLLVLATIVVIISGAMKLSLEHERIM